MRVKFSQLNQDMDCYIFAVLCNFVSFVQFKKREKHPWRSVTFSKVAKAVVSCNFTKSNTPPWVFFSFSKLYKWHKIAQRTTFRITCNLHGYHPRPVPENWNFRQPGGVVL